MDFSNKQIVVTGGTGALGSAVTGALLRAGAHCVVPYVDAAEAERFAHRGDPNVKLVAVTDLADETEVAKLFDTVAASTPLWASIHIAGGFAVGKVAETGKRALMAQLDGNLVSCFLCCRAAVNAMLANGQGGRIVNVAARLAGVSMIEGATALTRMPSLATSSASADVSAATPAFATV